MSGCDNSGQATFCIVQSEVSFRTLGKPPNLSARIVFTIREAGAASCEGEQLRMATQVRYRSTEIDAWQQAADDGSSVFSCCGV